MILLPGEDVADRFTVEDIVGRGGMAAVYRVRHKQLGSLHALKLLHVNRPSLVKRVLLEGRIQASLRHPNIIAVTDVVEYKGGIGLIMEYVDSASLEGWLEQHGPFSVDEALSLFAPILAGVVAAHDNDVLHRDLKPANVLLGRSPGGVVPKVTDFGIAKMLADEAKGSGTIAGTPMGTPGYMAPEQVTDSAKADKRADIFALGALLYALLCGQPPFVDDEVDEVLRRTVMGEWARLRDRLPGVPSGVDAAVEKALALRPDDRFPDGRSFGRALFAEQPALLVLVPPEASAGEGIRVNQTAGGVSLRTPSQTPAGSTLAPPVANTYAGEGALERTMTIAGPTIAPPGSTLAGQTIPPTGSLRSTGLVALGSAVGVLAALGVAAVLGLGIAYGMGVFESAVPEAITTAPDPIVPPVPVPLPVPAEAAVEPVAATPAVVPAAAAGTADPTPTKRPVTTKAPAEPVPEPVAATATPTEPAPEPVAAVAAVPEPVPTPAAGTADPQPPRVVGTYAGTANNRPFTLRIMKQDGGKLSGEIEFALGSTRRVADVMGKIGADGAFTLDEMGGDALHFVGKLDGNTIAGAYTKADGKALAFSVKKQP